MSANALQRIQKIAYRECKQLMSRPLYMFCMVIAPLICYIFFTTLMGSGLPTEMPIGVVDEDNTSTSRGILRTLDAFQQTSIVARYPSFAEARKAMQENEIYAFYYIPSGTTEEAQASRQPTISFYTNNSFMIAGSLLYKDLRTMSELAGGAVGRAQLYARGATEDQAMSFLQPIVIDTHPLNNPWLNYAIYLCNAFIPGILALMVLMITIYSIGVEVKNGTARKWMHMANNNIAIALFGKFLPQSIIFMAMAALYNGLLYGYLHFPCNSGILPMLFASFLMILASQGFAIFLYALLPALRLSLSASSLWGVVSISISGISFPVMAMHPSLQALSNLFPLRHYFLIYVNQALNGYPMSYAGMSYLALFIFASLPLLVMKRLKNAVLHYKYIE